MSEKKLIVPLARESKAKKSKPARNHLPLSLKKNDLELDFYSGWNLELMNKLLEKIL
ncbi:hypothetical protein [Lactobacillus johnsonii]|uniref:hypothetical protein n=1 Tax=Lactobacillus johnsonii TaxID=33959 RepID=UPI0013DE72D3|nr:hypothetical protein [Lactobacillus johnsonii]